MNLTWEVIKTTLDCSETRARDLLRKYKSKWKKDKNKKLLDNQRIPAWYFIINYSDEYDIDEQELCSMFGYDYELILKRKETI